MEEFISAVVGAVVGAAIAGVISFKQQRYSADRQAADQDKADRMSLVREVMRYRLDQEKLIGPLNEIPLVFGYDEDAIRLYRETLDAQTSKLRTDKLSDLINHLATLVDLPATVRPSDISRGFVSIQ
ncbi:hypothetical protein [Isoptericola rhizosphaerae]|uniref:hypothetical protein n=1 Tax=Isoptericola rhizosphaerae TaxID=3377837 RepID=UPI00383A9744